jgi:hypothetical protein
MVAECHRSGRLGNISLFASEPDIGLPLAPIQLSVMLLTQFPS